MSLRKTWSAICSAIALCIVFPATAAAETSAAKGDVEETPTVDDLGFLLGDWSVERIYQPGTENERIAAGDLGCKKALSQQFVRCAFYFERPEQPPIHDVVFFNYNEIYGVYESLWLSATWPIKVLMRAEPAAPGASLRWEADFLIEDGVREWVRSEWRLGEDGAFTRRVEIRTSNDPAGDWLHWMDERAVRK
ncbi:MAG: hypothetical protein AAGA09_03585 [Pseudomonadota bacterium]